MENRRLCCEKGKKTITEDVHFYTNWRIVIFCLCVHFIFLINNFLVFWFELRIQFCRWKVTLVSGEFLLLLLPLWMEISSQEDAAGGWGVELPLMWKLWEDAHEKLMHKMDIWGSLWSDSGWNFLSEAEVKGCNNFGDKLSLMRWKKRVEDGGTLRVGGWVGGWGAGIMTLLYWSAKNSSGSI